MEAAFHRADSGASQSQAARRSPAQAWVPWVLGGFFILWFSLRDLLLTRGFVIDHLDPWGHDFVNVWTAGHIVREGHLSALTDIGAYQAYQRHLFGSVGLHNYSYPPVTFPLAALFSYLPYPVALLTWQAVGAAFFIWAAKPWWPKGIGPAWLAVLTPAALMNIWAGHYGFFIGGLFLLGWRQVELGRPIRGGVCFGLMLIKPHLAILVPLALAMKREWRAIGAAAATVFGLVALTTLIYGLQPWTEFLFGTSRVQAQLIDPGNSFFGLMSTSPATAVLSLGAGRAAALVTQLAFVAGALWMVIDSGLRDTPLRSYAMLTSTATFLVLPYAFNYDLTVPMVGALMVMAATDFHSSDWRLAFYGFIAPQFGMVLASFGVPLMPAMIAGLAVAQFRRISARSQVEFPRAPSPATLGS